MNKRRLKYHVSKKDKNLILFCPFPEVSNSFKTKKKKTQPQT